VPVCLLSRALCGGRKSCEFLLIPIFMPTHELLACASFHLLLQFIFSLLIIATSTGFSSNVETLELIAQGGRDLSSCSQFPLCYSLRELPGKQDLSHCAAVPIISTGSTRNLEIRSECFNAAKYTHLPFLPLKPPIHTSRPADSLIHALLS
jgi:hypothetical protein